VTSFRRNPRSLSLKRTTRPRSTDRASTRGTQLPQLRSSIKNEEQEKKFSTPDTSRTTKKAVFPESIVTQTPKRPTKILSCREYHQGLLREKTPNAAYCQTRCCSRVSEKFNSTFRDKSKRSRQDPMGSAEPPTFPFDAKPLSLSIPVPSFRRQFIFP